MSNCTNFDCYFKTILKLEYCKPWNKSCRRIPNWLGAQSWYWDCPFEKLPVRDYFWCLIIICRLMSLKETTYTSYNREWNLRKKNCQSTHKFTNNDNSCVEIGTLATCLIPNFCHNHRENGSGNYFLVTFFKLTNFLDNSSISINYLN